VFLWVYLLRLQYLHRISEVFGGNTSEGQSSAMCETQKAKGKCRNSFELWENTFNATPILQYNSEKV
jgi:hypothetical protein